MSKIGSGSERVAEGCQVIWYQQTPVVHSLLREADTAQLSKNVGTGPGRVD